MGDRRGVVTSTVPQSGTVNRDVVVSGKDVEIKIELDFVVTKEDVASKQVIIQIPDEKMIAGQLVEVSMKEVTHLGTPMVMNILKKPKNAGPSASWKSIPAHMKPVTMLGSKFQMNTKCCIYIPRIVHPARDLPGTSITNRDAMGIIDVREIFPKADVFKNGNGLVYETASHSGEKNGTETFIKFASIKDKPNSEMVKLRDFLKTSQVCSVFLKRVIEADINESPTLREESTKWNAEERILNINTLTGKHLRWDEYGNCTISKVFQSVVTEYLVYAAELETIFISGDDHVALAFLPCTGTFSEVQDLIGTVHIVMRAVHV